MLQRRAVLLVLTAFFLIAAKQRAVHHPAGWPLTQVPPDAFSSSNFTEVSTRHVALDLTVDFTKTRLTGSATLDIVNHTGTNTLRLDTSGMTIHRVRLDDSTSDAQWSMATATQWSTPLDITITPTTDTVTIEYTTSSSAPGLFWNTAEQSYGRKEPYLYSLNEPIGARGWIPIQDTPSMRLTYEATIRAPRGLMALMSANDNPVATNDTGVYMFNMSYKIPVYLIAIAVGRLEFHAFDERTGVYAEPELMEDAAWELAYLPEMVDIAERMVGPFPFERHDVLLMPPTFVAGGMEHPMLNFIAPFNLITGNKPAQLTPSTLIAHELAHSWAGDQTTLANWNDVWLNEGITSYLENRIIEEMRGAEVGELLWHEEYLNYEGYANSASAAATTMHRQVPNPNTGFGSTGYVKGALFIKTLEDNIGRPAFDYFLRRYFQTFSFRWVDDVNFLAALREYAIRGNSELENKLRLDEWIYQGGLPSNVTAPRSAALVQRAGDRAFRFNSGTTLDQLGASSWTPVELELFLSFLPPQTQTRMAQIDAKFNLSALQHPSINWIARSVEANYTPAYPAVERVLMRGGPSGTMVALYQLMVQFNQRDRAREIFSRARGRYRDDVERTIATILGVPQANALRDAA